MKTYTRQEVRDWLISGGHTPGRWKNFKNGWRNLACKCGVSVTMFRDEVRQFAPIKCSKRKKIETALTPDERAAQFIRDVPMLDPDDPCPHMLHVCHPYKEGYVCSACGSVLAPGMQPTMFQDEAVVPVGAAVN